MSLATGRGTAVLRCFEVVLRHLEVMRGGLAYGR